MWLEAVHPRALYRSLAWMCKLAASAAAALLALTVSEHWTISRLSVQKNAAFLGFRVKVSGSSTAGPHGE
jgi:hypothetical protein